MSKPVKFSNNGGKMSLDYLEANSKFIRVNGQNQLEAKMSVALTDLDAPIQTKISSIDTIQTNLSTAQSNITNLQSNLNTAQTVIVDLQSSVITLQSSVETAQTNITNLQNSQNGTIPILNDVNQAQQVNGYMFFHMHQNMLYIFNNGTWFTMPLNPT